MPRGKVSASEIERRLLQGRKLEDVRKKRKMTQAVLAKHFSTRQQTIDKYEKGIVAIPPDVEKWMASPVASTLESSDTDSSDTDSSNSLPRSVFNATWEWFVKQKRPRMKKASLVADVRPSLTEGFADVTLTYTFQGLWLASGRKFVYDVLGLVPPLFKRKGGEYYFDVAMGTEFQDPIRIDAPGAKVIPWTQWKMNHSGQVQLPYAYAVEIAVTDPEEPITFALEANRACRLEQIDGIGLSIYGDVLCEQATVEVRFDEHIRPIRVTPEVYDLRRTDRDARPEELLNEQGAPRIEKSADRFTTSIRYLAPGGYCLGWRRLETRE